jgi:DNA-binding PucR family transcriptional regulator
MMKASTYERDPFKGKYGSLLDLVDKIKDVLNCPVTIEDGNHRLLAYSSHDDQTDSARIATIIKRRVPEKVINRLWKEGIIPKLMQSDEPVYIPEIQDIGLGNRVAIAIRNQNEILGYMWLVEESGKLSEEQIVLVKKAVQTIKVELRKIQSQKKKREVEYQDFFWQLLTGQFRTHDEIEAEFQELGIVPPTKFSILVFKFKEEISSSLEQRITYFISTIQKITIPFFIIIGNELILLSSPPRTQFNESTLTEFIIFFIDQMKVRFEVDEIKGSCGTLYERLDKIETSYQEALKVHSLKEQFSEEMNDIIHYRELGVFRYMDYIIEKNKLDAYQHPAIKKLEAYDLLNKTNLLETLEIFIRHDSNVNDAAKKLHVHTNTLVYRLKRISELGNINLKNINEKMSLYVELLMRRSPKNTRL